MAKFKVFKFQGRCFLRNYFMCLDRKWFGLSRCSTPLAIRKASPYPKSCCDVVHPCSAAIRLAVSSSKVEGRSHRGECLPGLSRVLPTGAGGPEAHECPLNPFQGTNLKEDCAKTSPQEQFTYSHLLQSHDSNVISSKACPCNRRCKENKFGEPQLDHNRQRLSTIVNDSTCRRLTFCT